MHVYLISGLGADRRAFQRLKMPPHFIIHHLDWIKPYPGETLDAYAKRLAEGIDQSQPFALVGLSFGGMIATAMTSFLKPDKTVLISSIGCINELPWYFRWIGKVQLHKCIPLRLLSTPNKMAFWLFGARRPSEKKLLSQIISETDPRFIRWAFHAILNWNQAKRPEQLIHIHGSMDKILPLRFTKPDVVVHKGSHFMVWTKAHAVSRALEKALQY